MRLSFRPRLFAAAVLVVGVSLSASAPAVARRAAAELPARLSDAEFWKMITDFSEPGGSFRSDNLLSNEIWFQYIVPDLVSYLKPGGVYLGVGPEQNFTYIAALKPKMVIIFDVRRGNLHTQLMYKALFELSPTRADFVSLLFSRERPESLTAESSVGQIFNTVMSASTSPERYQQNLKRLVEHLSKTRNLPLPADDVAGIDYVYGNFHYFGPAINYNSSSGGGGGRGAMTTYASLMTATDGAGVSRSFLANETLYGVLRDLHLRNLVVPIVGDFAGPKAIRSVGKYLRSAGATVTAFYLSNVEQYLGQNSVWQYFCNNVAILPLNDESTFIYSAGGGGGGGGRGGGLNSYYRSMLADVKRYNCSANAASAK